jgi:Mg2+-importing ATPase
MPAGQAKDAVEISSGHDNQSKASVNSVSVAAPSKSVVGSGLTSVEAADRLSRYGPNNPAPERHGAALLELAALFLNPLVLILLVACAVSFALGNALDAVIILVVLLLGIAINFAQTYRSQQAIKKLQEHVTLMTTVLRDGTWTKIKREEDRAGRCSSALCAGFSARRRTSA